MCYSIIIKGLDMINFPNILNSRVAMKSVPDFLDDPLHPLLLVTHIQRQYLVNFSTIKM